MWQIFQAEMLIYHSKAYLDMKILFCNITHLIDSEIIMGTKIPHSILVRYLLAIVIKSHF